MKLIKFSTVVLVLLLFLTLSLIAQETADKKPVYGWQKSVVGNLNLSQTSFDNWAQGGDNSLA